MELAGGGVFHVGAEAGAAACLIHAGGAYHDELLGVAKALGVDGGRAADHADGGELGDLVRDGHEGRDGAEGLGGEGGVEAGDEDAFAVMDEVHGEGDDGGVEELGFVDADDFDFRELGEDGFAEAVYVGYGGGLMGLGGMRGDGGAVVAEVDVRLEAGDALACDACALEAADEFFGFAGEHGADDDFDAAGMGGLHWVMVRDVGVEDGVQIAG